MRDRRAEIYRADLAALHPVGRTLDVAAAERAPLKDQLAAVNARVAAHSPVSGFSREAQMDGRGRRISIED